MVVFTGVIAVATGVYVWFTIELWRATNQSAEAAKLSANAALLNAQAVINSERAWIVVSVESPAAHQFNFRATNVGKTPARIASIYSSNTVARREGGPHVSPEYEKGVCLLNTPPCLLPPTASCIVFHCNVEDLRGRDSVEAWMKYLAEGFSTVWSYGKIIYFNTLEAEPKCPHETKWLYWHFPVKDSLPMPDPRYPEYNSYT